MHPGQTGTGHFGQSPAVQVDHAELKFPVFLCNLLYCPGLSESGCIDQHTDIRILILQPVFHLLVYQILFHVPCKDPDIGLVAFLDLFQFLFTAGNHPDFVQFPVKTFNLSDKFFSHAGGCPGNNRNLHKRFSFLL